MLKCLTETSAARFLCVCVSPPFLICFSAVCAGSKLMLALGGTCAAHSWPFHILTSSLPSLHPTRRWLTVPWRARRARRTRHPRLTGHPRGTSYAVTAFPAVAGFAWLAWKRGIRSQAGSMGCAQRISHITERPFVKSCMKMDKFPFYCSQWIPQRGDHGERQLVASREPGCLSLHIYSNKISVPSLSSYTCHPINLHHRADWSHTGNSAGEACGAADATRYFRVMLLLWKEMYQEFIFTFHSDMLGNRCVEWNC